MYFRSEYKPVPKNKQRKTSSMSTNIDKQCRFLNFLPSHAVNATKDRKLGSQAYLDQLSHGHICWGAEQNRSALDRIFPVIEAKSVIA